MRVILLISVEVAHEYPCDAVVGRGNHGGAIDEEEGREIENEEQDNIMTQSWFSRKCLTRQTPRGGHVCIGLEDLLGKG
jgi:hypothetical protein